MRDLFFAISIIATFGCNPPDPEDSELLSRYLHEVAQIDPLDADGVFVLQSGMCGSCHSDVVRLATDYVARGSCRYAVIMAARDTAIISGFVRANPRVTIYIDTLGLLDRYGLRQARYTYYSLRDGTVRRQVELDPAELKRARKMLSAQDCSRTRATVARDKSDL